MRNLLISTVLVLCLMTLVPSVVAQDTEATVSLDTVTVGYDEESDAPSEGTVTVELTTEGSDIAGYEAVINYDPEVVRVTGIDGVDFSAPQQNVNNTEGRANLAQAGTTGADNPHLANITLDIIGNSGEGTGLCFVEGETTLNNEEPRLLDISVENGSVVLEGPDGGGTADCEETQETGDQQEQQEEQQEQQEEQQEQEQLEENGNVTDGNTTEGEIADGGTNETETQENGSERSGGRGAPEFGINYSPSSPEVGQTVEFSPDVDFGVSSYEWLVVETDHYTSTEQASFEFNEPGEYTVVLTLRPEEYPITETTTTVTVSGDENATNETDGGNESESDGNDDTQEGLPGFGMLTALLAISLFYFGSINRGD